MDDARRRRFLQFGERAGRSLAEKLELPPEYFESDRPRPGQLSADAIEWAWLYERLAPAARHRLRLLYQVARDPYVEPAVDAKPDERSERPGPDSGLSDFDPPPGKKRKR